MRTSCLKRSKLFFTQVLIAVAEIGDRLATIDMGRTLGGGLCPLMGEAVAWTDACLRRSSYQVAIFLSIQPFGHTRCGPKVGRLFALGGGAGSASNTMLSGAEAYIRIDISINSVWPQ